MRDPSPIPRTRRIVTAFAIGGLLLASVGTSASGHGRDDRGNAGFKTSQAAMLKALVAGGSVTPIISTGDGIGHYQFESIPDGIVVVPNGHSSVDVYVNHETSRVPFPLQAAGSSWLPTSNTNGNQNDFLNSQVSKLTLSQRTAGVLDAEFAIDSDALYQRFCSSFLATKEHGFKRSLLFANEEGVDWVSKTDPAFPAFPGDAGARQIGVVVAYDIKSGKHRPIWGLGRLNHENTMAVPGYGKPVLITGDDTFTNTPAQSQLYSYIAKDGDDVWDDKGDLWAFVSDDPTKQKYEDFAPGDTTPIAGHFEKVPKLIATGRNPDGSEVTAAQLGAPYTAPPNDGSWQRFNNVGIDGPQWVLEQWSQLNDAFGFIRIEDTAYDRTDPKVLYLVDSGRGSAGVVQAGRSTNGRVWKMVLNANDPTKVDALSILIDGDTREVKDPLAIHQPDNIESTTNGLYITEDPGSQQNFPFGSIDPASGNFDVRATNARIMQYRFSDGAITPVAVVNQSADEGPGDVDPVPAGTHGFWEASGIIDVSSMFGPGSFLVTVQAHSLWVDGGFVSDTMTRVGGNWSAGPDGFPDWVDKREGGQLVLLKIPGA